MVARDVRNGDEVCEFANDLGFMLLAPCADRRRDRLRSCDERRCRRHERGNTDPFAERAPHRQRSSLKPGSIAGRFAALATNHPVTYIHFVMCVSLE